MTLNSGKRALKGLIDDLLTLIHNQVLFIFDLTFFVSVRKRETSFEQNESSLGPRNKKRRKEDIVIEEEEDVGSLGLSDIIGDEAAKQALVEHILLPTMLPEPIKTKLFQNNSLKNKNLQNPSSNPILLYGPPGLNFSL